jgi:hypothetical protein
MPFLNKNCHKAFPAGCYFSGLTNSYRVLKNDKNCEITQFSILRVKPVKLLIKPEQLGTKGPGLKSNEKTVPVN